MAATAAARTGDTAGAQACRHGDVGEADGATATEKDLSTPSLSFGPSGTVFGDPRDGLRASTDMRRSPAA
jgi:hypothetical protein